jgi:predicted dehydrogenase
MADSVCRWGFLSTAAIGRKNWKAIRLSGNGRVVAVASRTKERAAQFIAECSDEVPPGGDVAAFGSYDELLASDKVDAVYVPLPTGLRKQWVIKAAEAGKHVLCEKPVAIHADDAKAMIDACEAAGVQFMDGVMFEHSKRIDGLHASLANKDTFGELRRIQTHFSFNGGEEFAKSNIRASAEHEPHGCLGDLGWYCIRFTLRMMNGAMPTEVSGRMLQSFGGEASHAVPSEFVGEMIFAGGVTAGFFCSFRCVNQQTALISGSNGYVSVDDYVLPFCGANLHWTENTHQLEIENCRWNFGQQTTGLRVAEYASGEPNSQEVSMVRALADIVNTGKLNPRYAEISLKTQKVLDACRKSSVSGGKFVQI